MRLIDADALITELTEWMQKPDRDDVSVNVVDHLIGALKNEPSVDAELVRHGHWVKQNRGFKCDQCGLWFTMLMPRKYCPNCGSKNEDTKTKTI